MEEFSVLVPIEPTAKGRPRFSVFRGHVHTFTPKKTAEYEAKIAEYYMSVKGRKFDREQPLCISIEFGMPIPKSTPKSRRLAMAEGILRHIRKPDLDNLIKAVLDALNGIAWEDDAQVIRITAKKMYSTDPYVFLKVYESVD